MAGKASRNKGHRAEVEYAARFRELGYIYCKTAREGSRLLDSCGIDLINIPYNVQIKSGYKQNRAKADREFKKMKEELKKNFGDDISVHKPRLLIQKLDGYCEENELVTMTWKDFSDIVKRLKIFENGLAQNSALSADDRSGESILPT